MQFHSNGCSELLPGCREDSEAAKNRLCRRRAKHPYTPTRANDTVIVGKYRDLALGVREMASKKKTGTSSATAAPAETQAAVNPDASAKKVPSSAKQAKAVAKPAKSKAAKATDVKSSLPATPGTTPKVKAPKKPKAIAKPKALAKAEEAQTAEILDSQVVFEGSLFRVTRDHIIEPGGRESRRDVIRHNGSVVILAIDHGKHKPGKGKKNPWIVIERQYRHAAGQFLWELPAGKLDAGEAAVDGAKRELAEETGYKAEKWSALIEYFASPGFLGESMKVFLAEGLIAGDAHPEEDEHIDFRLVKLSDLLDMADKGKIIDGKTLTTILFYARKLGLKRKK
jgi:ADP-ribose pyrophosphatase